MPGECSGRIPPLMALAQEPRRHYQHSPFRALWDHVSEFGSTATTYSHKTRCGLTALQSITLGNIDTGAITLNRGTAAEFRRTRAPPGPADAARRRPPARRSTRRTGRRTRVRRRPPGNGGNASSAAPSARFVRAGPEPPPCPARPERRRACPPGDAWASDS